MQKPKDYDSISIGYTPIKLGGHKCVILEAKETTASTGKQMLSISFDMSKEDEQPDYFKNQYLDDKAANRSNLRWRGTHNIITDPNTEYGSRNLKSFVTSVENSNEGFNVVWGDAFCNCLKGKKIGVVFGKEEYTKMDGSLGTSIKPRYLCSYDKALEQDVPETKVQKTTSYSQQTLTPSDDPMMAQEGFYKADALTDEGLPFI